MLLRTRKRFATALLVALLPTAGVAETPETGAAEPTATPIAASQKPAPAAEKAESMPAPAAEKAESMPAPAAEKGEPKTLHAYTGVVQRVMRDMIVLQRAGTATDPKVLSVLVVYGGPQVKVSGEGKQRWGALRRGDLVLVSYVKGPPARARRVNVLRQPGAAARANAKPEVRSFEKPPHRSFIGYVKRRDGDELVVMKPPGPDPKKRPAEIKAFVRREHTVVEMQREAWSELKKGDRVMIAFQKGNPRPVDRVQVVWRGGEKPLPPGTATRLYDPRYDKSVKDVDGIGETSPIPAPVRRPKAGGGRKVKLPPRN